MTIQSVPKKAVTLSYGLFAGVLLVTLLIGLLSGALLSYLVGPPAAMLISEERPWIGITYIPITPLVARTYNLPVTRGALVVAVSPNSPALQAGLRVQDVITAIDQVALDESTDLMDIIMQRQPGERVVLRILRQGSEQTVEITLGQRSLATSRVKNLTPFERLRQNITRLIWGR